MYRSVLLPFAFILGMFPGLVKSADSPPATYIMQIASNLSCETLDIELISNTDDPRKNIRFTSSAFAAIELPAGTYAFGDVTCSSKAGAQRFDLLSNKIAPFSLAAGQAYYGGRMIFLEVDAVVANGAPKVLSNCTRLNSRARGKSSNECRDGVGVSTIAQTSKKIEVYLPEVTQENILAVRTALSATQEQLLYLPLKV